MKPVPTLAHAIAIIASLVAVQRATAGQSSSQRPAVVFSGRVVDLQGNPRIGIPVTTQVRFQNNNQPINAFDVNNRDIVAGREVPYNANTARFFLPIRVADIPPQDSAVALRFIISGQVISEVKFLSALSSLELDVVVPDPVLTPPYWRNYCPNTCWHYYASRKPPTPVNRPLARKPAVASKLASELRKWTNRDGTKIVAAKLVHVDNGKAYFERANGKPSVAAVTSLAPADQQWIQRWQSSSSLARTTP